VGAAVDDEVQLLEATVPRYVAEVEHPDVVLFNESDDVLLREVGSRLSEGAHKLVGVERNDIAHGISIHRGDSLTDPVPGR